MRTMSGDDDMSVESESCKIPISVKAFLMKIKPDLDITDQDGEEDQLYPQDLMTSNKMQPTREVLINYSGYPELDSDIGPSELSDIAEEPEDGLTSDDGGSQSSRGSTPKIVAASSSAASSIISHRSVHFILQTKIIQAIWQISIPS